MRLSPNNRNIEGLEDNHKNEKGKTPIKKKIKLAWRGNSEPVKEVERRICLLCYLTGRKVKHNSPFLQIFGHLFKKLT